MLLHTLGLFYTHLSMPDPTYLTPGVYVTEVSTTPNAIEPVPTAIPAFIGYAPKVEQGGVSYRNKVHKVHSFKEFNDIYGTSESETYSALPNYHLEEVAIKPVDGNFVQIGLAYYHMIADPSTQYYLFQSVKLFFENGGKEACILAVAAYGEPIQGIHQIGTTTVNANVILDDLLAGLELLRNETEPTLYICPEATLLSEGENSTLMKVMLLQQNELQTGMCIFDIIGSKHPDPLLYEDAVTTFRENTGSIGLSYGAAYYPFLETTLVQNGDLIFKSFFGGDLEALDSVLHMDLGAHATLDTVMADIKDRRSSNTNVQKNRALLGVSPLYREMVVLATSMANLLPPSGAMAGVMAVVDATRGVWKAPANVSIVGVHALPINLTSSQQGSFNVDSASGKSINVIRDFQGHGILVWGARTLDGNSFEWRYINVRRTMIFIEQSCKLAIQAYIFQPNTMDTWESVKAMINNFLEGLWRQGALMGSSTREAFAVNCRLGSTMTPQDILDGFMHVSVMVALMRPAEFIVLSFTQQMPTTT